MSQDTKQNQPVNVAVEIVGAERRITVGEWALVAPLSEDEPRILDVDLGARLGYPNPKDIRKLARDHEKAGNINPFHVRAAVARTGAVARTEGVMWFGEADAMWLASQSGTPAAVALTKEMIRVFMLARRGLLPSQIAPQGLTADQLATALAPLSAGFAAVAKMLADMNDRVAALEARSRDGRIGPEQANAIKARVRFCAKSLAAVGAEKVRAASMRMHKRLKMKVGWYGDRCRLDNLPARHEADVLHELDIIEHETRGRIEGARQLKLPHLSLVGNSNGKRASA